MTDRERPRYRGIKTFRDPHGRFTFRYPSRWHVHELAEGRDGIMVSPEAENPQTWFAVWATQLQERVVAGDLAVLQEGVNEGLYQLPDLLIESSSERLFGNLIRFERVYTFRENGAIRQRKVWILYVYKWAFALVAQGATPEEYEYWSIMLQNCINEFNLAPALWFASDPDNEDKVA